MAALDILVFGTVAVAVVSWSLAEAFDSRTFWTLGAALMIIHSVAAFFTFYQGSHRVAQVETMRQTAERTGVQFSGGIHINYLFLAVWVADVAWWWMAPASYEQRGRWVDVAVRGFIFFIILNGAVIFADGWARVVGAVAVTVVAAAWLLRRWSRRAAFTTAG